MSSRKFYVEGSTGVPLIGGAGGMTVFARDLAGAVRGPPGILERGEGIYEVFTSTADENAGTIYVIDTGAGNTPRHYCVNVFKPDRSNQFWAVAVEALSGAPWGGSPITIGSYRGFGAVPRTPPAILTIVSPWVFAVVPTPADVAADVSCRLDGPAGSNQAFWRCDVEELLTPPATVSSVAAAEPSVLAAATSTTDYGVDVQTWPELSDSFALISDARAVCEQAYRRLSTARGSLSFWPDVGIDLRAYLNESVTDSTMFAMRSDIEQELKRAERILEAHASVSWSSSTQTATVKIDLTLATGVFTLTLAVTSLTIEMLQGV